MSDIRRSKKIKKPKNDIDISYLNRGITKSDILFRTEQLEIAKIRNQAEFERRKKLKLLRQIERQKEEKSYKRLRRISIILGILIGIIVLSFAMIFSCSIENIEVKNAQIVEESQIQEYVLSKTKLFNSGINNTFLTFFMINNGFVETPKYLESLKVEIKSLNNINLVVKEKELLCYVDYNNKQLVLDKAYNVIEDDFVVPENIIKVEGVTVEKYKLYNKLEIDNSNIFDYISIISKFKDQDELPIETIDFSDLNNITVKIGNMIVKLGGSELLEEKMSRIKPIREKIGDASGELHLENYEESEEMITFNNY